MLDPKKLAKAVDAGWRKMKRLRDARYKFLAAYSGRFYAKHMADDPELQRAQPLALMNSAMQTYVSNLVYNDPSYTAKSQTMTYRDYAAKLKLGITHLAKEVRLRETARLAIVDALVMAGWVKTGLAVSGQTLDVDGVPTDIGQPFADYVGCDDMVIDPLARRFIPGEYLFVGNRFRLSKALALDSGLYDNGKMEKIPSRYDGLSGGDMGKEAESFTHATNTAADGNEYADYIDLVELWLPMTNTIVTMACPWASGVGQSGDILREVDYEGPERGPYHLLGFSWCPDNLMPVAPAGMWYDLHQLGNKMARKIARQADRQKTILAYDLNHYESAKEISDADDGETIGVEDVEKLKEFSLGGATEDGYAFVEWVKRNFSEATGNLDLLSGTKINAPTATQSEMLQANTSVRLADGQYFVHHFLGEIGRDLAWFLHTDPLIDLPLIKRERGIDQQIRLTPEDREGDFLDYEIDVEPTSLARADPNVKVRRKLEFATNVLPGLAQAYQLLGPGFNIAKIAAGIARDIGIEDADEMLDPMMIDAEHFALQAMRGAGKADAGGAGPPMGMAPMGGRPVQPNPMQMGPNGGVSPPTEVAMGQQETAGELQGAYPSARELAMSR